MGERSRRSFIARWWLLIPMGLGAMIWWAVWFGQARKVLGW